jgi:thiol-disulfide isomerase/thioredoxin
MSRLRNRKELRACWILCALFLLCGTALHADFQGPTNPKAQKTYAEAKKGGTHWHTQDLIEKYRKADSQDGGHCAACAYQIAKLALKSGDPKLARKEAIELEGLATTPADQAIAHTLHGQAAMQLGFNDHKQPLLAEAETEFRKVMELHQADAESAILEDGVALANLHQDEAARARFQEYLNTAVPRGALYARAARYAKQPALARERMAPAFALTTLSGEQFSMDDLQGKVVLVDFWATWCGPCREALPRVQNISKRFAGQPLVVLSVSLDKDQNTWKAFVAKNHMDWPQYCDGGFEGPLAQSFGVRAIPATFTIDADGVVQDQHVGDADIDRKLKKLVAAAAQHAETPAKLAGN